MTVETWIMIAAVVFGVALIALAIWFVMRRGRTDGGAAYERRARLEDQHEALHREIASLRDHNKLLEDRVERYDRVHSDLRDQIHALREEIEGRLTRMQAHDQTQKELQEQIYEMRQEHKVLMERDERHERRVNELQEQVSVVREDVVRNHGDGHAARSERRL